MPDARANPIESADRAREILARAKRIAILGIKPEERAYKAAFYVSRYLLDAGYDIVPVPVYYPECTEILGRPVYRRVADVPGPIDLVDPTHDPSRGGDPIHEPVDGDQPVVDQPAARKLVGETSHPFEGDTPGARGLRIDHGQSDPPEPLW
jgi:hypothetical protein